MNVFWLGMSLVELESAIDMKCPTALSQKVGAYLNSNLPFIIAQWPGKVQINE